MNPVCWPAIAGKKNGFLTIPNILLSLSLSAILLSSCGREGSSSSSGMQVPDGFTVEKVADETLLDFPMFASLDATGRLFVFESSGNVYEQTEDAFKKPQFRVKMLEDTNEDGVYDKSTIFADSLRFPQGGAFYNGSLYVTCAPDFLKLTDTDGDGVADQREVLLSGWVLNVNANSLIGPFFGADGRFYMTSAITGFDVTTKEGKRLKGETARIWRVNPDGSGLEWISAGGMNNPVEITFTEAGEVIGTETYFTNPKGGLRDALVYWVEGGIYPKPNTNIDRDGLIRTGELMPVVSQYSRVAPSGVGRYRNTAFGNDFKDNLFSVQFNTHKVIRHKLFREGGSFRTEDETMLWVDDEDFHPTDVLEDADGSLLVVETGGWFIKGCPLSQVSKPELKGAIYRIRKKGAAKVGDPYGNKISWEALTAGEALGYLKDTRPFVSDRAAERLVALGGSSVASLKEVLEGNEGSATKVRSVYALYRIGSEAAKAVVRKALADADVDVRIAAAKCVGLAGDAQAEDALIQLLNADHAAVIRQAATALGQLKSVKSSPALLDAAGKTEDRFARHALIYSLIQIGDSRVCAQALDGESSLVREAALIALDQMVSKPLKVQQVIPFWSDPNPSLQQTALWVTSHHPEWASEIVSSLGGRLQNVSLGAQEKEAYRQILVSMANSPVAQRFLAGQLDNNRSEHVKILALEVMKGAKIDSIIPLWADKIGSTLKQTGTPLVTAKALELIRLKGKKAMSASLAALVEDAAQPHNFRVEARDILASQGEKAVSDKQFDYFLDQLMNSGEVAVRLQSASLLSKLELTEPQQMKLAKTYLPVADSYLLPGLLPVFGSGSNSEIGKLLAETLLKSEALDSYSEETIAGVFANYPVDVKPEADKVIAKLKTVHGERLSYLKSLEKEIPRGNMENGRALFFGKAVCSTCHTVGPEGGNFGPDLTSIQKDRSAHDLLEAIVYPSASFVREYETYRVKTAGEEYVGIIAEKTPEAITLNTAPQNSVRILRSDIVSMEIENTSLMPQGLDKTLTTQEIADLMAFLLGQDQDPRTDQQFLR